MKVIPDRRRIGTKLIFLGYRFTKIEKQKPKFVLPAPTMSAFSMLIIFSFSVNNDFDFCEKGIQPIETVSDFDWLKFFQRLCPPA